MPINMNDTNTLGGNASYSPDSWKTNYFETETSEMMFVEKCTSVRTDDSKIDNIKFFTIDLLEWSPPRMIGKLPDAATWATALEI